MTQTTTADGTATAVYNGRAVEKTDVNGVQRITQYDLLGRISGVCEISSNGSMPGSGSPVSCGMDIPGTGFLTTYSYNLATRTTTISQGMQNRTFQTDAAGRTIYTNEPERGSTTYGYSYNATGLVVTRNRPTANQSSASILTLTTTQYDSLGRPLSIVYKDGTPTKQFQYDQAVSSYSNAGQMTTATTVQGNTVVSSTQFNYDILGNVTSTTQCLPGQCGNAAYNIVRYYTYDPTLGRRTQESYLTGGSSGTRVGTNLTYSVAGELQTMANTLTGANFNSGAIVSNVQNSVNGPTLYTLGNGLNGVRTYDGLGRSAGISLCANSVAPNCSGGNRTYQMTQSIAGGRVTAMNDSVLGTNATASYDEFNRLVGINYATRGQAFSYVYDRYGNRWDQNVIQGSGVAPQLTFNVANNQLITTGYAYYADGTMQSDGSHSYHYDAEGNMVSVDGGGTAAYTYDAFNHRVRTTTSSADTYFTFNTDGLRVASWNAASATPSMLAAYAYWNGMPIAAYSSSGVTYQHQDLLGTKRLITSSNGSTAATFQSLPFGDVFTATGTDSDPSHFALLDHDSETITDHAQFRQYSPTSGNWMSPDPYDGSYDVGNPQSLNRYTYALNSPLSLIDPSGEDTYCADFGSNPGNYSAACQYVPNDAYNVSQSDYLSYYQHFGYSYAYSYTTGVLGDDGSYTILTGITLINDAGLGTATLPRYSNNSQLFSQYTMIPGAYGFGGAGSSGQVSAPNNRMNPTECSVLATDPNQNCANNKFKRAAIKFICKGSQSAKVGASMRTGMLIGSMTGAYAGASAFGVGAVPGALLGGLEGAATGAISGFIRGSVVAAGCQNIGAYE